MADGGKDPEADNAEGELVQSLSYLYSILPSKSAQRRTGW